MRRFAFVLISAVFGVAMAATTTPASADSPHFLFADNSVSGSTGALTTSFKDAGLGTGATSIQITLSVDNATAVYQCFNNGGNHPKAGNKETVSTSLTTTGTFPVRHGQTTASLTVGPPGPGDFSCPSGQSLFLQEVTYSGIVVSDETGNSLNATPDPIGTGPIHVRV
ncbi:MAG TPA: hypothetical protein VEX15_15010 [Nocardioidaceae bacterium]|nr:hypothetical protein [Nocardioidaceae bacterium]